MEVNWQELHERSRNWRMKSVPEGKRKTLTELYMEGRLKSPGARRLALEQIAESRNQDKS